MRYDRRLSRTLHVLLHLKDARQPITSAQLGEMLGTHAAFVRQTMAGLRERGWVSSTRGQGGGWRLVTPLAKISLLELYEALGSPSLFAVKESEDAPQCLMEQAANAAVGRALSAAEVTFRESLASTTVADLAQDFQGRLTAAGHTTAWIPPSKMPKQTE